MFKVVEGCSLYCILSKEKEETDQYFSFFNQLKSVKNTSGTVFNNDNKNKEKSFLNRLDDFFCSADLKNKKMFDEYKLGRENGTTIQYTKIRFLVKKLFCIPDRYQWPLSEEATKSMIVFTRQQKVTLSYPRYSNEVGYIEDVDGEGTSVLVIHANKEGSTGFYNGDFLLGRVPNKDLFVTYNTISEMVSGLKHDKNIDLTRKKGTLHFVACYMGNSDYAKELAKITKRTVITYGNLEKVNTGEINKLKLKKGTLDVRWSKLDYIKLKANYDTYL